MSRSVTMNIAALRHHTHPIVIGAAASVMIASLVVVGALTGVLPIASSQKADGVTAEKRANDVTQAPSEAAAREKRHARVSLAASCPSCGVVESIRTVEVKGEATGVGAVAGGVAGGVIGHQFGKGRGNAVATVIGAAGGAYAGHEIEKNVKKRLVYRVTVHMDDGSYRTLSQSTPPSLAKGAKVQIVDGVVVPRS